jgi:hypothetical protein
MSRCRPSTPKLLSIAFMALLPALAVHAAPQSQDRSRTPPPRDEDRDSRDEPRSSLSDAVRRVERDTRGEVLSAERVQYDGRDMHRVKVVDDQGRVRVFMQDPSRQDGGSSPPPARDGRGAQQRRPPPARDDDG